MQKLRRKKRFLRQQQMHPRDRLKKMTKKLEFDAETLKEIPYINIDVPVDTTESENKIMDCLFQTLPSDSDRYYIETTIMHFMVQTE